MVTASCHKDSRLCCKINKKFGNRHKNATLFAYKNIVLTNFCVCEDFFHYDYALRLAPVFASSSFAIVLKISSTTPLPLTGIYLPSL